MPALQGEENRYLLSADAGEGARVRLIPGHRYSPAQGLWLFPRQAGVVLALDRVFGVDGWTHAPELAADVEEARARRPAAAQGPARAELDGSQLAVQCIVADKELVKLVPGYHWSPAQKRWYVPALPLALEILQERFGRRLAIGAGVLEYFDRRRDEDLRPPPAVARTMPQHPDAAATVPTSRPGFIAPSSLLPAVRREGRDLAAIADALDAMAATIARLEQKVDRLVPLVQAPPAAAQIIAAEVLPDPAVHEVTEEWHALLALSATDPAGALDQANRLLQTISTIDAGPIRAVAGIAAQRAGQPDQAFEHLSRVLVAPAELQDGTLSALAESAYVAVALDLINADCGPLQPIATIADFARLINQALVSDAGFAHESLGSGPARSTLDLLVNNQGLRRVAPALSDYCRVAHLLATAPAGSRLAGERVAGVLRERSLSPEATALALVLFANLCMRQRCVGDWAGGWPAAEEESPLSDGGWLVRHALEVLPGLDHELAAQGALAVLGCIAGGPAEQASLAQRRALVQLIPPLWPWRQHAEFLAVFRLVAKGEPLPLARQFSGYLKRIGSTQLAISAPHLTEVYLQGSGVRESGLKPIADGPYLESLARWGVKDPQAEVLDLLPLLEEGSRPDNALNALGRMIEDRAFPGAERMSSAQRKQVYGAALAAAKKMGHDDDAREAFDRLVRELRREGATAELRSLCSPFERVGPKALRVPALIVLLDTLLEAREPFEDALDALIRVNGLRPGDDGDDPVAELGGLTELYPELDAPLQRHIAATGAPATVEVTHPDLAGKRVVFIGGHQWLKKRAMPVLQDRWKIEVEWLEPTEAKNGPQALGLAGGSADLVVINTRCIGHAASGRAKDEAVAAGTRWLPQNSHGVGSLLTFVRKELAEAGGEARPRPRKVDDLKRRARR